MKIGFLGFDFPQGKVKFQDEKLSALEKKFHPRKVTPFYAEFLHHEFLQADAIIISRQKLLDLLILDMEKLEARQERTPEEDERQLLTRCLEYLEQEIPLCEVKLTPQELQILRGLAPLSLKPTVVEDEPPKLNEAIEQVLSKAGVIFFYTAGPKEVHAWPVKKDADIVTCAGKIHSDLARGFIRADIVRYHDLMQVYNLQEARTRGFVRLVDRDYCIQPGDIVEIRFNI
jgi:ribosome-binding ATPase YchF (GTP1/OBG family)